MQRSDSIMRAADAARAHGPFALFLACMALFFWLGDQRLHRNLIYGTMALWALSACRPRAQAWTQWWREWKDWLLPALLLYMAWQCASLGWSPAFSGEELFEAVRKSMLTLWFVAMAAALLGPEERARRFWLGMIAAGAAAALASLLLFLLHPAEIERATGRLTGIGRAENPIQAAALYGVALLAAGYCLINAKTLRERLPLLFCWSALLLALLLTQARGGMLAAAAGHLLLAWRGRFGWRGALCLLLALAAALALSALWMDWADALARADSYRLLIWEHALAGWRERPLLGLGFRAPFLLTLPYGQEISQPHSIYICALYYGGVAGLAALLLLLGMTGRRLWRRRARPFAALYLALWLNGAIFALADFGLLLVGADVEWLLFWLPVAGAFAVRNGNENPA